MTDGPRVRVSEYFIYEAANVAGVRDLARLERLVQEPDMQAKLALYALQSRFEEGTLERRLLDVMQTPIAKALNPAIISLGYTSAELSGLMASAEVNAYAIEVIEP